MDTIHFEWESVPVRTISLHEFVETFFRYNTLEPKTEHCIKKAFLLLAECVPFESGGVYCTRSCVGGEEMSLVTDGTVQTCATCGGVLISLSPALFLFSFSGREVHHD